MRQYRRGRLELKLDTSDLEPRIAELGSIARGMTLPLLVVGVLVASAIAANAASLGPLRPLRDVALGAYAIALVLGAVLVAQQLWRAFRRQRHSNAEPE